MTDGGADIDGRTLRYELGADTADADRGRGSEGAMDRVTFRMERPTIDALDRLVAEGHYANRSEAIRSAVSQKLRLTDGGGRFKRDWPEPPRRSVDNYAAALARVYRELNEAHLVAPHPEGREFVAELRDQVRGELQVELEDDDRGDE